MARLTLWRNTDANCNEEGTFGTAPYVIFRAWEPNAWDFYDWQVKTGKDFGAFELSPDPEDRDEAVEPAHDWDGQLDENDNQLFVVLEKPEVELLQKRLDLVTEKCDFAAVAKTGVEPCEVDSLR